MRAQPEVSWGDVWFNSLWNLLGPRTDKTFGEAKQKLFAAAPLSGARTPMHFLRTLPSVIYWMCSDAFTELRTHPLCLGAEWPDQKQVSGTGSLQAVTAAQPACDARMLACRHRAGDRAGARQHAAVRAQRARWRPHPKIRVLRAESGNAQQVARECPPGWCAAGMHAAPANQLGRFCAALLQTCMF
jgi:hypothetical protein